MDEQTQPASSPPTRPALRAIYQAHFAHVWSTLRRLGVVERDLEDAAHEVFVVVQRRLADYDPARPLRPWLSGIAYKVASDERRRARHRHEVFAADRERAAAGAGPEEQAMASQERALVLAALLALPDERRVIFVMHELDDCRMPDIAEALEVPLNTCYSRLRLAREQFTAAVRRLERGRGGR